MICSSIDHSAVFPYDGFAEVDIGSAGVVSFTAKTKESRAGNGACVKSLYYIVARYVQCVLEAAHIVVIDIHDRLAGSARYNRAVLDVNRYVLIKLCTISIHKYRFAVGVKNAVIKGIVSTGSRPKRVIGFIIGT